MNLDNNKYIKLNEGHSIHDLGFGYYADIDEDQYELHLNRIDVEIYKDITGWHNPHYDRYIATVDSIDEAREFVKSLCEEYTSSTLEESSMTAEQKVDAWHNGTRRENYKAAGEGKLRAYLEIARSKAYDDIVNIIEGELARRGLTAPSDDASADDNVRQVSANSYIDVQEVEEPVADSSESSMQLTEAELEALLGMAIFTFGANVLSVNSYWKSAGSSGYYGSYVANWRSSSGSIMNSGRAVDKAMNLAYNHDKLIVLVNHSRGGYYNIDRYYSINVPSSTEYIVDRREIYNKVRNINSYYDSEIDWGFYTLTKNKTNQRKVTEYIMEKVPELTSEQAQRIAADFFNK